MTLDTIAGNVDHPQQLTLPVVLTGGHCCVPAIAVNSSRENPQLLCHRPTDRETGQ
jgi:hypothetical protein